MLVPVAQLLLELDGAVEAVKETETEKEGLPVEECVADGSILPEELALL